MSAPWQPAQHCMPVRANKICEVVFWFVTHSLLQKKGVLDNSFPFVISGTPFGPSFDDAVGLSEVMMGFLLLYFFAS